MTTSGGIGGLPPAPAVDFGCCGCGGGGGTDGGDLLAVAQTIFQTQVNTNVYTDVFDMEVTFDGDGVNRTRLDFAAGSLAVIAGVANPTTLRLWDDTEGAAITHAYHTNPSAGLKVEPTSMTAYLDPFVGTKTVKVQMKRNGAGTTTINGDGDQPRLMSLAAYRVQEVAAP